MEDQVSKIYLTLQKLLGLQRQLLDTVRLEREALIQANLDNIQKITAAKQTLIEDIHRTESIRIRQTSELAAICKKPYRELTLQAIIISVQGINSKLAEQLRGALNALTVIIDRINEQNKSNLALIEQSLVHVSQMKKNILLEAESQNTTYTPSGQRASSAKASRILSKEA